MRMLDTNDAGLIGNHFTAQVVADSHDNKYTYFDNLTVSNLFNYDPNWMIRESITKSIKWDETLVSEG